MAEVQFHVTVLGDCGLTHPSHEDWAACGVCRAIMDRNIVATDQAIRRRLYPFAGTRDAVAARLADLGADLGAYTTS